MHSSYTSPDLDAIARNLTALDLAHLTPEESADYELELSAIASLNEVLAIAADILRTPTPPAYWQCLYPLVSDAAALLASQLAPLLDLNAERSFPITQHEFPWFAYRLDPALQAYASWLEDSAGNVSEADIIQAARAYASTVRQPLGTYERHRCFSSFGASSSENLRNVALPRKSGAQ